jgi:hypothetical protein
MIPDDSYILSRIKPLNALNTASLMPSSILVLAESFNWFLKTFRVDFIFKTDTDNIAIYVNGVEYPSEWLSRKTLMDRRSLVYIKVIDKKIKNTLFCSFLDYLKENELLYLETECNPVETTALHLADFKKYAYQYFNNEITEFLALVDNRFITSVTDIPDRTVTGLIIVIRGYAYLNTQDILSHPVSVPELLGLLR